MPNLPQRMTQTRCAENTFDKVIFFWVVVRGCERDAKFDVMILFIHGEDTFLSGPIAGNYRMRYIPEYLLRINSLIDPCVQPDTEARGMGALQSRCWTTLKVNETGRG